MYIDFEDLPVGTIFKSADERFRNGHVFMKVIARGQAQAVCLTGSLPYRDVSLFQVFNMGNYRCEVISNGFTMVDEYLKHRIA